MSNWGDEACHEQTTHAPSHGKLNVTHAQGVTNTRKSHAIWYRTMIVCIVFTWSLKLSSISLRNLYFFACQACKSIFFSAKETPVVLWLSYFTTAARFPVLHASCVFFRARHRCQVVPFLTPVAFFQPIFPRLTADTCVPAFDAGYSFSRAW